MTNSLDIDQARCFVRPDLGQTDCKGYQQTTLVDMSSLIWTHRLRQFIKKLLKYFRYVKSRRLVAIGTLRVNSLPTGQFCMLFFGLLIFYKSTFFVLFFQEYHHSVKQFETLSGLISTMLRKGLIWVQTVCKLQRLSAKIIVGKQLIQLFCLI